MLSGATDRRTAAVFADVLREPERAAASSAPYRQFQPREVPALLAGRLAGARLAMPVKLLAGRGDPTQHPSLLEGLEAHAVHGEVELVEGGHFLVDERPELVAERALQWFAEGRR
jgi:pimeloyl-ACP methyl ester carboxylesterase